MEPASINLRDLAIPKQNVEQKNPSRAICTSIESLSNVWSKKKLINNLDLDPDKP